MHLYIATKGIKKDSDDFIRQLEGKWLPIPFRETAEQPFKQAMVQLSVRPIQLHEIGFPKDCKDIVCATILGAEGGKLRGNNGKEATDYKFINWIKNKLSRLLGLQNIGEYKTDQIMPIHKGAVAVVGLGIKEDYIMPNGVEGL